MIINVMFLGIMLWEYVYKKLTCVFMGKKTFYFPLTPRMQAYLVCPALSTLIRWHKHHRNDDGMLRDPRDGKAWEKN